MVACVALVLGFRQSSDLAAAYGIAVTGTMAITTVLFSSVARAAGAGARADGGARCSRCSSSFDLAFFAANAPKIAHGGWFPLAIGVASSP